MQTLTSGDVVRVDLGTPIGSEAGMVRPAVVVTAQPMVVHVVPLTTTLRGWSSEVEAEPSVDAGLTGASAAQAQHVRAISVEPTATLGEASLPDGCRPHTTLA